MCSFLDPAASSTADVGGVTLTIEEGTRGESTSKQQAPAASLDRKQTTKAEDREHGARAEAAAKEAGGEGVKRRKRREARDEAEKSGNTLHVEMFDVADQLGGKLSSLRDADADVRFECKDLIFGVPQQAALGVEYFMCIEENKLRKRMMAGVQAIRDEVRVNGTDEDEECLEYVLDKEASSKGPRHAQAPGRAPAGGRASPCGVIDPLGCQTAL